MTPWAAPEFARRHWTDARHVDDVTLADLLAAATNACRAYAPACPLDEAGEEAPPIDWQLAVVQHARELHAAWTRQGGVAATDVHAIRPRPLLDSVRQLLRPHAGPVVL